MADELKLDIIVNDQGSAQKLAAVDAGVKKVIGTATQGAAAAGQLSTSLGGVALTAGRLVGLTGGLAAFFQAISVIRGVAEDASRLADVAERLDVSASKFQKAATAASEFGVSSEQLAGAIGRLQARIGSGQIDSQLERIGLSLDQIGDSDGVDQLRLVAAAIGDIEDPSQRAAAAVATLGRDGEAMRGILTAAFADAAAAADAMSDRTIKRLDEMGEAYERLKSRAKNTIGEITVAMADFLTGRDPDASGPDLNELLFGPSMPTAPGRPGQPGTLPTAGADPGWAARNVELLNEQLATQTAITENLFRMDDILRQIDTAQAMIVKSGGDWSDVLNTRVAAAVDNINAKYVQAVMLNTQLMGGAQSERDRLMQQLTATTDPNESAFDKRFHQIDQDAKAKLAAVDQTDRVSAAAAENAILEEMNLKVLELQQHWDGVITKTDSAKARTDMLNQSYQQLASPFVSQAGGGRLPNGLTAPTAEQVATGRYFGPVTPNGQPDLARMGGAVPAMPAVTVNAQGAFLQTPEAMDQLGRMVADVLARRESGRGQLGR